MIYTSPLVYMCPLSSAVHLKRPPPQPQNHVEGRLPLDFVVEEGKILFGLGEEKYNKLFTITSTIEMPKSGVTPTKEKTKKWTKPKP